MSLYTLSEMRTIVDREKRVTIHTPNRVEVRQVGYGCAGRTVCEVVEQDDGSLTVIVDPDVEVDVFSDPLRREGIRS